MLLENVLKNRQNPEWLCVLLRVWSPKWIPMGGDLSATEFIQNVSDSFFSSYFHNVKKQIKFLNFSFV